MKSFIQLSLLILIFGFTFQSCEIIPEDSSNGHCPNYFENIDIIGGGSNQYNSYRNNHYEMNVNTDNTIITLSCIFNGTNGRMYILNSAGDYIQYSSEGQQVDITSYNISKSGKYYIIICAEQAGTYDLDACGSIALIRQNNETSALNQQKTPDGGGINTYNSWRNIHYAFEVKNNSTYIDFLVNSKSGNTRIYILNSAGNYIQYSSEGTRPNIVGYELPKGKYQLIVCNEVDKPNNFDLSMYFLQGSVSPLTFMPSTSYSAKMSSFTGDGINEYNSPKNKKYRLVVNELTHIDCLLKTSGLNGRLYILNSAGNYIQYSNEGVNTGIISYEIPKGIYTIVVCGEKGKSGKFDIGIVSKSGSISDLQTL
jgi:hypothetical protein